MEALTQEQIETLLGSVRERGKYPRLWKEFLASDLDGINVTELFPSDTKPTTLYQGFNNVKKNDEANGNSVRVINHDETVYLIKQ